MTTSWIPSTFVLELTTDTSTKIEIVRTVDEAIYKMMKK